MANSYGLHINFRENIARVTIVFNCNLLHCIESLQTLFNTSQNLRNEIVWQLFSRWFHEIKLQFLQIISSHF